MAEALSLRRLKRPARMQHDIGGELHRIVPAKILEIEERQCPVRLSQAIVEAEIRRNEAAPFLREFGVKSKAGCRHRCKRLRALDGEPRRDGIINEINQFMLIAGGFAQARQTPLNLPFDLAAVETGFRCRRLFGGPRRRAQAVDSGEENDRRVDIGIAHFGNVIAVDPAQKRIAVLGIDAEHTRHRGDAMALHQPQRADFGREPVAWIVAAWRILLERKRAVAARHAPDAAVAAAGGEPAHLDGIAGQRLCDAGRFGERAVGRAQEPAPPKTCRSMSRHVGQLM